MPLKKPCAWPGCTQIVDIGQRHRPTDARAVLARRHQRTRRDGRHTTQWQRTRRLVLERDEHLCTRCGQPGNQVHSLLGGFHDDDIGSYETVCTECHGRVHGGTHQGRI